MKKTHKKTWLVSLLRAILGFLALLIIFLGILSQSSSVQTFLVREVSNQLTTSYPGKVSFGKVNLKFIKSIEIDDLYLEDAEQDTLLFAKKVVVDISLFSLFKQKLILDELLLDGITLRVHPLKEESIMNYEKLLQSFASPTDTPVKEKTTTDWEFSLSTITIRDANLEYLDSKRKQQARALIGILQISIDAFNQEDKVLALGSMDFGDAQLGYYTVDDIPVPANDLDRNSTMEPFEFPGSTWAISLDNLVLRNHTVEYRSGSDRYLPEQFQPNHLQVELRKMALKNMVWNADSIGLTIAGLDLREGSLFQVLDMNAAIGWSPHQFHLKRFFCKTGNSVADLDAQLMVRTPFVPADLYQQTGYFNLQKLLIHPDDILYVQPDFFSPEIEAPPFSLAISLKKEEDHLSIPKLEGQWGKLGSIALSGSVPLKQSNEPHTITVSNFVFNPADINPFLQNRLPASLDPQKWKSIEGQTAFTLQGDQLALHYLHLHSDSLLDLKVEGSVDSIFNGMAPPFLALKIQELTLNRQILSSFAGEPSVFPSTAPNSIFLGGNLRSSPTKIGWVGNLQAGNENVGGEVVFSPSDSSAPGQVSLNLTFEINHLTDWFRNDMPIKNVRGSIFLESKGFQPEEMEMEAILQLDRIQYEQTTFTDVYLSAGIVDQILTAEIFVKHPHLAAELCAGISFKDTLPAYSLQIGLKHLDVDALGFSQAPLFVHTNLDLQAQGNSQNNLTGFLQLQDVKIGNDTALFDTDSLRIDWHFHPDRGKVIELNSALASGTVNGRFDFENIGLAFLDYLENTGFRGSHDYVPVDSSFYKEAFQELNWDFKIPLNDYQEFFFLPDLDTLKPISLAGTFHSAHKMTTLNVLLPDIDYGDYHISGIRLEGRGDEKSLATSLQVSNWKIGEANIFSNLLVENILGYSRFVSDIRAEEVFGEQPLAMKFEAVMDSTAVSIFHLHGRVMQWPFSQRLFDSLQVFLELPEEIDKPLYANLSLAGPGNQVAGYMSAPKSSGNWQGLIDIESIQLAAASPWAEDNLKNLTGQLSGRINLGKENEKPILNGTLELESVRFFAPASGMHYSLAPVSLWFSENRIGWQPIELMDESGGKITVSGHIDHQYFDDITFFMDYHTDKFQFFNAAEPRESFFYGAVSGSSHGFLRGQMRQPVLQMDFKTLSPSNLVILPYALEQGTEEESWVTFGKPESDPLDDFGGTMRRGGRQAEPINFQFNANLGITRDFDLKVLLDPEGGDQFICSGKGDLSISTDVQGNPLVSGNYTIESGIYNFSYEGMIKKAFTLKKGSTLYFVGDPYNSRFDITAIYEVKTPAYPLLAKEGNLSGSEIRRAQRPTPFQVLMHITGDIESPTMHFDIQPKAESREGINDLVVRKLELIKNQPSEWNKQVFSLLLFNSFMNEGGNNQTTPFSEVAESGVYTSVNNLITNQLNKLASTHLKNTQVTFGMSSYTVDGQETRQRINEMEVNLSKQLFNDRFQMTIGGNLDFGQVEETGQNTYRAMIGDFVLEYFLNEAKTYSVQIFHVNDANLLQDEMIYKTGAGIRVHKNLPSRIQKKNRENK